jgi:3-hydroxyisobutyrate dehydrogenase-like beta-hydroxyacid dehydrogenase
MGQNQWRAGQRAKAEATVMTISTIGVMSPGDMGHAVGRALGQSGFRVVTALAGRSDLSRELAARGGLEDAGTVEALVSEADLVLSIMPPSAATAFATCAAEAMQSTDATPLYADCNAIAPATSRNIGEIIGAAGASYVDGGIIGPPPGHAAPPRLYVSGPDAGQLVPLSGAELNIVSLGDEIGRASALKMCYAALTKGSMTLDTAVLLAGTQLGVYDELKAELAGSQQAAFKRMENRVPWLATDAGRWIGEMEEIAATFDAAGLPAGFHQAAADIFRLLASTPLAEETRDTADRARDDAL